MAEAFESSAASPSGLGGDSSKTRPSAGRVIQIVIGWAIIIASVGALCLALVKLLHTGTCASGNSAYQITRQCPKGTGLYIALIPLGLVAGGIGMGLARTQAMLAWGLFFSGMGGAAIYGGATSHAAGGKLGGIIVGVIFVPMGVIPLLLSIRRGPTKSTSGAGATRIVAMPQAPARPSPPPRAGSDPVELLEQLADLHKRGVLNDAEFAKQKARILGES